MYRDFSEKSKQNILNLVSQVENEKLCDFTDWVGDRWYDFESWIGTLNIKKYLNDVNSYHKKVIDKNNASQQQIEKIFSAVSSVDGTYKSNFSFVKASLQQWQTYIDQMAEIVNPQNGKFSAQYMAECLDALLRDCNNLSAEASLSDYLDYDSNTGKYNYNWDRIEALFAKDASELTEADIQILIAILGTMMDERGIVDAESLQRFINAGYSKPSLVTKDDFHESFEKLPNGSEVPYYYLQNKSYMSDVLKMVCLLYNDACESASVNGMGNNLNNLLQILVENYSVIEWRSVINPSRDYWSGKLYISEKDLDWFNALCSANITLEFVDSKNDPNNTSGLDYYLITSNAANYGNVRTATVDSQLVRLNDPNSDGYSDYTVRMYIDCGNANTGLTALKLKAQAILAQYYKEFNIGEVLSDELIKMVAQHAPFGRDLISSLYDLASQTDALGAIKSSVDGAKSADLNTSTKISEKTEKGIDIGLGEISRILGIVSKYKAVEKNNKIVEENQNALEEFASDFEILNNLGIAYTTMTVKYDHTSYNDSGRGIKVDNDKDCAETPSCEISVSDYQYSSRLLLHQYETAMHIPMTDDNGNILPQYLQSFEDLENQVKEYIKTGNVSEGSILAEYMKQWPGYQKP